MTGISAIKGSLLKNKKRLITVLAVALAAAIASGALYTTVIGIAYGAWGFSARVFYSVDALIRILFFFAVYAFVGSCIAFDRRAIFDFIFKHRWQVALGVFALLVLMKINFSSVGAYDYFVQHDLRTDTTLPIFGIPRSIRSDEWLVYVPRVFTSDFEGFGKFNYILRATENYSISANGLKLGLSALCSPMTWGYYLFGAEYGLSFYWSFLMVMSFMASYEFSLIITRGSRRLALLGAAFIGFSQFTMWWSVCTYLISAQMLIVAAYYFFGEKRLGRKIFLAAVAAFSATFFITALYPAWQVPYGYIIIGLIVWLVITKFKEIRALSRRDIIIIAAAFLFMAVITLAYLKDTSAANSAILATVYPGERFYTGGGALIKSGAFLHTPLLPFKSVGGASNNSESAVFFSLFPLPIVFSVYSLIRQIINKRRDPEVRIDIFNIAVLIPTLFLTVYASIGFPAWLAKYSLLSYSMNVRAADFVGLGCIYLMLRNLSNKEERVPVRVFAPVAVACAAFWIFCTYKSVPGYMPVWFCVLSVLFALALAFVAYARGSEPVSAPVLTSMAAIMCVLGLCVHPVMCGADALVRKPVALAVREVVEADPDAKWIGYGNNNIIGQYLVANGAPTVNSVHYIPNLDFWHLFDPEGEDEFIYNRYAHVSIEFTDGPTEMELIQADYVKLDINFGDIKKTGVSYVAAINGEIDFGISAEELLERYGIGFELLYSESRACIYRITYR